MPKSANTKPSHIFIPDADGDCEWCPLPIGNKVHNAAPVKINKRTRRTVYVKPN